MLAGPLHFKNDTIYPIMWQPCIIKILFKVKKNDTVFSVTLVNNCTERQRKCVSVTHEWPSFRNEAEIVDHLLRVTCWEVGWGDA